MDPLAVGLARNKLIAASAACEQLQLATNYEETEFAWSAFLTASSTIYSKLEQGAKKSGKSLGWFGRKKKERKDDPLLRYLHFARNSDEHGIEHITHRDVPTIDGAAIGFTAEQFGKEVPLAIMRVDPKTNEPYGPEIPVTLRGPNIVLRAVSDTRFGDTCQPPDMHLGNRIALPTPQLIATLGLAYLTQMVNDAAELVAPEKTT